MKSSFLFFLCAVGLTQAWILQETKASCVCFGNVASIPSRAARKIENKKRSLEQHLLCAETTMNSVADQVEIIGAGRIGSLLVEAGNCVVLGREDRIDPSGYGPILIATRNDALDGIVDACPEKRKKDLVFLQNGYLDDFLASKGLLDNTQALLYFSVTAKGVQPVDGVTTVNPEGLTAVTGIHSQAFADRLASLNLNCNVVTPEQYRPAMFEKLIWISTYMLVGTAKECSSVGRAASERGDLIERVVDELVHAVSAKEGIKFPEGTMKRLAAYTDVVADFPCGVKEFEWRNKYFYSLGDDACPIHNGLLRECAEKRKLNFQLA